MKNKKPQVLTAQALWIVDERGETRIGLYAGKRGYAGISLYKGEGRKRYQALHIYVADHNHGVVEIWTKDHQTCLTVGAGENGSGLSIFDVRGRPAKAFGLVYDQPEKTSAKASGKRQVQWTKSAARKKTKQA